MSQTGTPTEFLKLGITEPDDTLNVLVDLNGQWQKIDTGVKNVDTKANTNASGISALNTAVQDNTENITNILETNVNQQTSIDTLQSKVATLEEDDTSYGTRITAVEAGVQENSELINDLEVDLSGVKTSVGTVPSGSNLQGEVDGLDTRVTALENSGSVAAVEARVTTLETEVGTVPAGETVQGQITTLNGQVNSGNIPFRFSVDGEGNYGYLKADDSFVPFSSGDSHWKVFDSTLYSRDYNNNTFILPYKDYFESSSTHYHKMHDLINNIDYTIPHPASATSFGNVISVPAYNKFYIASNGILTEINNNVLGVIYQNYSKRTYYLTNNGNNFQYHVVDVEGNTVGMTVNFSVNGFTTSSSTCKFSIANFYYTYNNTVYLVILNTSTGQSTESVYTDKVTPGTHYIDVNHIVTNVDYDIKTNTLDTSTNGKVLFNPNNGAEFFYYINGQTYYYL